MSRNHLKKTTEIKITFVLWTLLFIPTIIGIAAYGFRSSSLLRAGTTRELNLRAESLAQVLRTNLELLESHTVSTATNERFRKAVLSNKQTMSTLLSGFCDNFPKNHALYWISQNRKSHAACPTQTASIEPGPIFVALDQLRNQNGNTFIQKTEIIGFNDKDFLVRLVTALRQKPADTIVSINSHALVILVPVTKDLGVTHSTLLGVLAQIIPLESLIDQVRAQLPTPLWFEIWDRNIYVAASLPRANSSDPTRLISSETFPFFHQAGINGFMKLDIRVLGNRSVLYAPIRTIWRNCLLLFLGSTIMYCWIAFFLKKQFTKQLSITQGNK